MKTTKIIVAAVFSAAFTTLCAKDVDVRDFCGEVDLFIGSEGEGNLTPAAAYPNGMLNPGPDTLGGYDTPCPGYRYSDRSIAGFSQWHVNGTGHPGLGDVLLFPYCGALRDYGDPARRTLDHSKEKASPGYYSLETGGVLSEMTTSRRANMFRFTRRGGEGDFRLLVDLGRCLARVSANPLVRTNVTELAADRRGFSGWTDRESWGRRAFSYHAEFSRRWKSVEDVSEPGAKAPVYVFTFDVPEGGSLSVKVAFSYSCSVSAAKRNLVSSVPGWDFDSVRAAAAEAWRKVLSRIEIDADAKTRKMFYTSLYRFHAQPTLSSDAGKPDRYTLFSLWDTFRASHPLYTILSPGIVPAFVDSFLDQYERQGYLPVWTLADREINCMIANHSVPVIVDAYLKGLLPDPHRAWKAVERTLTDPETANPKVNWPVYDRLGYFPNDLFRRESCSRTLECAYDDACAARMAKALGKGKAAAFFAARSGNWRNLFDSSTGFIRSRDSKGAWRKDFDPYHSGWGDGYDFTEGNSWQYSWHVMHDPRSLIAACGGEDAFRKRLSRFFDPAHDELGHGNHKWYSEAELIGQYWHGNEPCQHIPWLWRFVGEGRRTDAIVREVFERFYRPVPAGLTGNDDCGQMSAWYIFAALGFYPFDPCGGEYVISAPQISKALIHLPGGKTFTIKAEGLSGKRKYAGSVRLNGRDFVGFRIRHSDIVSGGEIVYEMCE